MFTYQGPTRSGGVLSGGALPSALVGEGCPGFPSTSPLMMRLAMTQCAHTIKRMVNNHGCSPAGCVSGVNPQPRYPIWCQFTSSYDERSQLPDDEAIGLQQSCGRSCVLASREAAFRRPLLAQVCRQPGPFEMDKVVMYK